MGVKENLYMVLEDGVNLGRWGIFWFYIVREKYE